MEISQNAFIELADRYLRGEMDENERSAFEEHLASDDRFHENFKEHRAVVEELQRRFFRQEVEAYLAEKKAPDTPPPSGTAFLFNNWYWIIAAIVVIVLLLWKTSSSEETIEQKEPPVVAESEGRLLEEVEPEASAPAKYDAILDTLLFVQEIELSGKTNNTHNQQVRIIIKKREHEQPEYQRFSDTLHVWLQKDEKNLKATLISIIDKNDKKLYLGIQNQWFRIDSSEGKSLLKPENDQDLLRLLRQAD
jgi:hypothetical protein